jgi:hypothetical protein
MTEDQYKRGMDVIHYVDRITAAFAQKHGLPKQEAYKAFIVKYHAYEFLVDKYVEQGGEPTVTVEEVEEFCRSKGGKL